MELNCPIWYHHYLDYFMSKSWRELRDFLKEERKIGKEHLPLDYQVFKAFEHCLPRQVRVVIVGQDPYPNPNHSTGMAFSIPLTQKELPRTLKNIFRAIKTDLGIDNTNGSLLFWAVQGVLLLNTALTVEKGKPGSHLNKGWETFTDMVLNNAGSSIAPPTVFMLWGEKAKKKRQLIDETKHLVLEASHPSPLSAHLGFMWCKHFSKANEFLKKHKRLEVDWRT